VFEKGKQFYLFPFKAFYIPNNLEHNRILISVPKRLHKKAVTRNLIKRRIREAYRLNPDINSSSTCSDINIVYISNNVSDFAQIQNRLTDVLGKIKKDSDKADLPTTADPD